MGPPSSPVGPLRDTPVFLLSDDVQSLFLGGLEENLHCISRPAAVHFSDLISNFDVDEASINRVVATQIFFKVHPENWGRFLPILTKMSFFKKKKKEWFNHQGRW